MNKLAYGLLSLLSSERLTGYELTSRMKNFRHTNHSAIYPMLTELHKNGFVEFELIKQKGKPDKKLFSITESGLEELRGWVTTELEQPVKKDELTMRFFSLQILDHQTTEALIQQVEKRNALRIEGYKNSLRELNKRVGEDFTSLDSHKIGSFLLLQKGILESELELSWCRWIRNLNNSNNDQPISCPQFLSEIF